MLRDPKQMMHYVKSVPHESQTTQVCGYSDFGYWLLNQTYSKCSSNSLSAGLQ